MKRIFKQFIQLAALVTLVLLVATRTNAQQNPAYTKAISEIESTFGTVPLMFKVYPEFALAGAWENFKQLNSPDAKIPPKYRELLQLAVAAQIPCQYCVYFHTASAKAFGATDAEIEEAVAQGANTRQWSMVLQGNQVDLDAFKAEMDAILKKMSSPQAKK